MMNSSLGDMLEKRVTLLDILSAHVTAPGRKACPRRTAGRKLIWGGISGLLLLLSLSACQASPATPTQHNTPLATTVSATDVPASAVPTAPATRTPTPTLHPSISNATHIPTLPACWKDGGRVEKAELELETLPQPLQFRVYLPPCYDELPAQHYPVLYLIHGQSFNDDQWERLGAPELVDRLSAKGELPPFIIVMPRDRVWSEPTEDQFGQAVIDALVPYVDASYRTRPERSSRAIGGLSRGGAWALHLGLSHWETFGAIGMHSGFSFQSDDSNIRRWLDAIPVEKMPRFYMDISQNDQHDIAESAAWIKKLLTERAIAYEWHLYPGYHQEDYWRAHLEQYLRWYAEEWK